MPKRVTKKIVETTTTEEKNKPSSRKRATKKEIEKQIVENLIELQKVHINLAEKFDRLSNEISSLLALFEMAARSFAKNPSVKGTERDHEFLEKIDKLLEQNKTIAKGLTLMEGKIRERMYGSTPAPNPTQEQPEPNSNRPLPRF